MVEQRQLARRLIAEAVRVRFEYVQKLMGITHNRTEAAAEETALYAAYVAGQFDIQDIRDAIADDRQAIVAIEQGE